LRDVIGARTLFATHYHELTDLARLRPGVANFQVAVREEGDRVAFLHRIVKGGTDKSYGLHVARLAGIPTEVVERARNILPRLERDAIDLAEEPPARRDAPRVRRRQGSLLFDLYEGTLDSVRNLQVERLSPDEALATLRRLQKELDASEQI